MASGPYLVGIDVGTTNCKVGIFDVTGRAVATSVTPTKVHPTPEGYFEYWPGELWSMTCRSLRRAISRIDTPEAIRGVAVASMGEAGTLLDRQHRALHPIIPWFDHRTGEQEAWWRHHADADEIYRITGLTLEPIWSINKIMWLQRHAGAVYREAARWACVADLIAYWLSGEHAMDFSLASRTMAFDIRRRRWSDRILGIGGVDRELLPPVLPSGTVIGEVSAQTSRMTGLPKGAAVVAGGHDHICGALAVGAVEEGVVLDSMGTAEAVMVTTQRPHLSTRNASTGFHTGCHVARDRFYLIGGLFSSGDTVQWFVDRLGYGRKRDAFRAAMADSKSRGAGASGLLFLPHLRGAGPPLSNPASRGALVGLRPTHTRADLLRAAMEGIAFEVRAVIEAMERISGKPVRRVRAIGGGSSNPLWLSIRANVTGRTIDLPGLWDATPLGAAMLAGIGTGLYRDERDAIAHVYRLARSIAPDKREVAIYQRIYPAFQRLYASLRPIHEMTPPGPGMEVNDGSP